MFSTFSQIPFAQTLLSRRMHGTGRDPGHAEP